MTLPVHFANCVLRRDVLDVLRDDSVDMIYGDPDYGVGINYNGATYTRKWDDYIVGYIARGARKFAGVAPGRESVFNKLSHYIVPFACILPPPVFMIMCGYIRPMLPPQKRKKPFLQRTSLASAVIFVRWAP